MASSLSLVFRFRTEHPCPREHPCAKEIKQQALKYQLRRLKLTKFYYCLRDIQSGDAGNWFHRRSRERVLKSLKYFAPLLEAGNKSQYNRWFSGLPPQEYPCSQEIIHFVCNSKPLKKQDNRTQYPLEISKRARDRTGAWSTGGWLDQHRKVDRSWWELQKIYDGKCPSYPFLRSLLVDRYDGVRNAGILLGLMNWAKKYPCPENRQWLLESHWHSRYPASPSHEHMCVFVTGLIKGECHHEPSIFYYLYKNWDEAICHCKCIQKGCAKHVSLAIEWGSKERQEALGATLWMEKILTKSLWPLHGHKALE